LISLAFNKFLIVLAELQTKTAEDTQTINRKKDS
jgi:hypothetical protein